MQPQLYQRCEILLCLHGSFAGTVAHIWKVDLPPDGRPYCVGPKHTANLDCCAQLFFHTQKAQNFQLEEDKSDVKLSVVKTATKMLYIMCKLWTIFQNRHNIAVPEGKLFASPSSTLGLLISICIHKTLELSGLAILSGRGQA